MKRYQRLLIWSFTFGFGLIWILAFFLPNEIGGSIDSEGMYGADLVGKRVFYSTGKQIVMLDLDNTKHRTPSFDLSAFRNEDYFGASYPSVFKTPNGWKMIYLGNGKDDVKRICFAESMDGTQWQPITKTTFTLPNEISPSGPNWIRVEKLSNHYSLYFSAFEKGRSVIFSMTSLDLINWQDPKVISRNKEDVSVISHSNNGSAIASVDKSKENVYSFSFFPPDNNSLEEWMKRSSIIDIRFTGINQTLFTFIGTDKKPRIAIANGQFPDEMKLLDGSLPDGSIAELGKPGFKTGMSEFSGRAAVFVQIVMNFGLGLGLIGLLIIHFKRIKKEPSGKSLSAIVILSVIAMLVVQIMRQQFPNASFWNQAHELLFFNLQFPLGATMFGLLAAFLISAAYRAFRIRSFDSAILTAVATLVLLTQVPTAQFLASVFGFGGSETAATIDAIGSETRTWILTVVNDAVQRAVAFGAFVGAVAMALRIWLSIEPKN